MMTYGFQFNFNFISQIIYRWNDYLPRGSLCLLAAGVRPRPVAPWGLRWLETQSGAFILLHWGAITATAYISVIRPSPPPCRRRVWRGWCTSTPLWWWWWWPTWRSTWSLSSTSTSTTSRPGPSGSPGGRYRYFCLKQIDIFVSWDWFS